MEFGIYEHHLTVKSILNKKVKAGELTQEQADKIYVEWLKNRRIQVIK